MKNPHFDENIVLWNDEYSGKYASPQNGYEQQFDLQWKIALEQGDYFDSYGASTEDDYIKDRVYEWTGINYRGKEEEIKNCKPMDRPIDVNLIKGKKCIDIGCGMGRWTKTMQMLGAESVLSID